LRGYTKKTFLEKKAVDRVLQMDNDLDWQLSGAKSVVACMSRQDDFAGTNMNTA
jgi:hypothetical protein